MKYVAAFLMAKLSKETPTAADLKTILSSVDCKVDDARLKEFMAEVEGKDITELIAEGSKKMATVGGGGGSKAAPAAGDAAGNAGGSAAPAKEAVKEESEDGDMGFGLFD